MNAIVKFSMIAAMGLLLGSCSKALSDYGYALPTENDRWYPYSQNISPGTMSSSVSEASYDYRSYRAPNVKINEEALGKELMHQRIKFLKGFYARLSSKEFDFEKFNERYASSLCKEMQETVEYYNSHMSDKSRKGWAIFMDKTFGKGAKIQVEYDDRDWYKISTEGSECLYVQVKMPDFFTKPQITGLFIPQRPISALTK